MSFELYLAERSEFGCVGVGGWARSRGVRNIEFATRCVVVAIRNNAGDPESPLVHKASKDQLTRPTALS